MARSFNSTSSTLTVAAGAVNPTGAYTYFVIARRAANGAWHSFFATSSSNPPGSNQRAWFEARNDDLLIIGVAGGTDVGGPSWSSSDGWSFLAVTKASGVATPRFHKYVYGTNTWTHANGGGTMDNSNSMSGGSVEIGSWRGVDFYDGDMAAMGIIHAALTDAQIENLPFTVTNQLAAGCAGLWVFDQSATGQKVVDLTGGGANESSSTALGISASHPPVFNYSDGIWLPTKVPSGGSAIVLDAVLAGVGGIAPDLVVGKPLAVSLAGTGGITADVKVGKPLAAALAGTSSTSADLKVGKPLAALLAALGGIAADLRTGKPLAATLSGSGSTSGNLTVGAATSAAVLSALGSVAAVLRVGKPLAAVLAATSSVTADLRAGKPLAAVLGGTSAAAAQLRVGKPLQALLSASSTLQADLKIGKPLAALLAGACTISAALTVGVQVVGDKMKMRRGSGL